ncbi:16S rRNA (guanine(527)-N(7))-methyltransferase RsmG [Chachezhania sediminis]|uniref:16S rRNA (guanine(527)-N(7))-methyltransferase RsmG n=1 Tax=Chachezhania sediminis TaxID=2599291 RepID=UPI00131E9EAD|nr:16S rRNA (guanine(527)-N(7))-methyltransferase RsmG [Chachezhania sediminis]
MTRPGLPDNVSRETMERLEIYAALLEKWNPKINLVSKSSIPDLWNRHILDSVQVWDAAPRAVTWADLGSGGGFPGLVIAILAAGEPDGPAVTLIESDQRKAAFLRTVSRETGIDATIIAARIEAAEPQRADVISARALASLDLLLEFADRHLAPGGTALFPKGETWEKELAEARQRWQFSALPIKSRTQPGAVILSIEGVSRV